MIESPLTLPLSKRPDITQKIVDNQISGIEMKIGDAIVDMLGLPIIRQLLIYNPFYPNYPFEIDIYIPDKDLAIDVDGRHHQLPKVVERQKRKDRAVMGLTGIEDYQHINVTTPHELVYWDKRDEDRERIRDAYNTFNEGLIYTGVIMAKNAPYRENKQLPRILKDNNHYKRGLTQLEELKNYKTRKKHMQ